MANTSKSKKQKGVRLENKIVSMIKDTFKDKESIVVKRMPKSGQLKDFKADIFTNIPISIEAKNQENWRILEWWDQCVSDSKKMTPVLVVSKNRMKDPHAFLYFKDLLVLIKYAIKGGWNGKN